MSKIWDILQILSKILDIFSKKSKIQKSVPSIFRTHIEVPLDQLLAS